MYTFSIIPLTDASFEEMCLNIKEQCERGVCTTPMFMMNIVPEGTPVWDKATVQCEIFARYRDALAQYGIRPGVLIQSSMGHGYSLTPTPFQRVINLTDGKDENAWCPEDPLFIEHFKGVVHKIALERPAAIMLDDDVRLIMRPGRGCVCPRHMAEFKRRTGCDMNREELYNYFRTHADDDPLTMKYIEMQRDSLVKFVTEMRAVIDSVDPTIQGINCTSGDECDSVIYTNPIFAGKGNPTMVRVPNGIYYPETVRGISDTMRRAAICGSHLKKNGIEILLAECDTIPHNRYCRSARYLHSHYTSAILEGLMGAKHWIMRLQGNEIASDRAYLDILAKHNKFYDKLSKTADGIKWVGANSMYIEQMHHTFTKENIWEYHSNNWTRFILERMGIPFYFSDKNTGAAFLDDDIVVDMTEEQIEDAFNGSLFLSSQAAEDMVKRGYGDRLGVDIADIALKKGYEVGGLDDVVIKGETFDGTLKESVYAQKIGTKKIIPLSDDVEILSSCYAKTNHQLNIISPAVTAYPRDNGKLSVVFCGKPGTHVAHNNTFLNQTRKKQFISLLKRAGALPVYYPGDNEILLRAGFIKDNRLLVGIFDLSFDPMENIDLYLENKPGEIKMLTPDGDEIDVSWTEKGNNLYTIDVKIEPLYPVILLIK